MKYSNQIKEKWQKFTEWKVWKFLYWIIVALGSYVLFSNIYNIIIDLIRIDEGVFSKRLFYPFSSVKIFTLKAQIFFIIYFSLPCFASLFYEASYFKKIIFVFSYLLVLSLIYNYFSFKF